LQNRHPAPCGHLNHANDHDITELDPTLSDPPLTISRIETPRVRLAILVGNKRVRSVSVLCVVVARPYLEKGIHGLRDVMREV
jgi:hypothetical protein